MTDRVGMITVKSPSDQPGPGGTRLKITVVPFTTSTRICRSILYIPYTSMSKAQALRELPSVRDRCEKVYKLAQEGKVDHFVLNEGRYEDIIEVCAKAINVSAAWVQEPAYG